MTDRELLEAAAKAAGEWPSPEPFEHVLARWNPLTDDGDALRLAVRLQLQITPGTYNKDEFMVYNSARHVEAQEYWNPMQDEFTATRRAIVRAAAALSEAPN